MKTKEIIEKELEKITATIKSLIPPRVDISRVFIFQVKDAMDAGLISEFEARKVLEFNGQPFNFPCFNK